MRSVRDSQREKVYQAEFRLRDLYDTAVQIENYAVELDGIRLQLPPEAKFASIASIQSYVDRVIGKGVVTVRERRGAAFAHYEPWSRTVAINTQLKRDWACREIVVLHELAHHMTRSDHTGVASHGPQFVGAFTQLLSDTMGPEAGLAYRVLCNHSGAKESV